MSDEASFDAMMEEELRTLAHLATAAGKSILIVAIVSDGVTGATYSHNKSLPSMRATLAGGLAVEAKERLEWAEGGDA